jgi:hypothetical protein
MDPIIILRVVTVSVVIFTLYNYDRLVRDLRDRYSSTWETLGKPSGFFVTSARSMFFPNLKRQWSFFLRVTFGKPGWGGGDGRVLHLWRVYVASYLFTMVCGALIVVVEFGRSGPNVPL